MRKAYIGKPGAQLHYREMGQGEPLILLPPSPHSGLYYTSVMPYLAKQFHVIAPDYPGFGGSDALPGTPSIENYAISLIALLRSVGGAHITGFHSGNLVALEIVLTQPNLVRNLVMVDVPYFDAATQHSLDGKMGQMAKLPDTVMDLEAGFNTNVSSRMDEFGHQRAYEIWTESLRAGTGKNAAFHAAFTYDCEHKFPACSRAASIIATQSGLLEPTRKAATVMPNARLIERLDIDGAVFDKYADAIADVIRKALRS